ncbi:tyrosine-type recombinase/integrase [Pseudomonas aeruginosa]|uniref:tyrosine-type recombinase/integrase n=1 Tax=Pseudomonas aeruginosa TaxID=287 RepID=UPI001FF850E0|nr:site-specific integrase [Pseudomonas aeruginosa]MCK1868935.1 site-specific integrase [Pseudomonas aeruginosa]MCK1878052.1 site-specific integrase [Pseudomonas aeruginosa]MCK1887284.1 site-specific integrase [Pseudomonas aeruginosa]UPL29462.1 site-specific integrase [Pseudomonas aeruginosa]WME44253.1 site-specific integrase [Pseudomonas aeruginosa]
MKLVQSHFSSGQRVPVLVQDGSAAPLPKLVPFIYVQLRFKHRAYNTVAAHLRAIQAFYIYAESRELDIDEAIMACHFETILALLDGYTLWLQSGRQADNLVARIGTTATASLPPIDPHTRDQYLRQLKQYLSWSVTRYIPRARQNSTTQANLEVAFADVADVIERRFDSHITNVRPDHARYRSLTDPQLQIVRTLIRPGAVGNPFPKRLQLRNWLMIELLLETGMRRGELLKLYTTDINKGSQHAYVTINDREHDPADPRAEEPALKTHGRTVGISAQLYEVYEHYIQSERRPLRDGKPMKLLHRYLFISDRGRPLSIRALSNVLDRLFLTIELAHPGLLPTLSAHDFRHTFADRFLAYLVEQRGHDLERATDELRRVCGWAETSAMPRRYASRYLAESANRHNAQRASAAWGRLDS